MPHNESVNDLPSPPTVRRMLTATLQCYLCGQPCGVLEAPAGAGLPPMVHFTPVDGSASQEAVWQRLRCPRCGSGSLMVDQLDIVTRRVEQPVDLRLEKRRRGRPPRSLTDPRPRQGTA